MEQEQVLRARREGGLTRDFVRTRFAGNRIGVRRSGGLAVGPADYPRRGDHSLTPGAEPPPRALTPAAVLVPIVERSPGLTVLLTQRTAHLAAHAGQISFPGGHIEPTDPDPVAAALREAEEEVGLPQGHVEPFGRLDTYITSTGFEITPVVAFVRAPYPMRPDPYEVAEVFEVPLAFVVDPANHHRRSREANGTTRTFFVLPYENRYIWGATAGMLVNLAEVLRS
jgi:8-oxo-dGTP pyrophosphatase MutT (NUDIX family)